MPTALPLLVLLFRGPCATCIASSPSHQYQTKTQTQTQTRIHRNADTDTDTDTHTHTRTDTDTHTHTHIDTHTHTQSQTQSQSVIHSLVLSLFLSTHPLSLTHKYINTFAAAMATCIALTCSAFA